MLWKRRLCAVEALLVRKWLRAVVQVSILEASLSAGAAAALALILEGVPARAASATDDPATAMTSVSVSLKPARAMMLCVSLLSTRICVHGGSGVRGGGGGQRKGVGATRGHALEGGGGGGREGVVGKVIEGEGEGEEGNGEGEKEGDKEERHRE